jgi:putative transposase
MKILPFLTCFETLAGLTFCRRLAVIAEAMLTIPGRVTKLSLSRWTTAGGSYRTLNRFFTTRAAWSQLLVKFFETHLFKPGGEYILAGDETVVGKAGHETFGLDRYFSSLRGQVIKGLSFFVFALINVEERKAYPLAVKQMVRSGKGSAQTEESGTSAQIEEGRRKTARTSQGEPQQSTVNA